MARAMTDRGSPVVTVAIVTTLLFGQARYRAVAEAPVAVLAAVALEAAWTGCRRLRDDPEDRPAADPSDPEVP